MSQMTVILAVVAVAGLAAGQAERVAVPFDYGWQFKLGDPATAKPALTTASLDPSFTKNVSGMSCTQLAWSQLGRMGDKDCRGACSATPGCLVWQWAGHVPWSAWDSNHSTFGCFIHDGTLGNSPTCVPNSSKLRTIPAPLPRPSFSKNSVFSLEEWCRVCPLSALTCVVSVASPRVGRLPGSTKTTCNTAIQIADPLPIRATSIVLIFSRTCCVRC